MGLVRGGVALCLIATIAIAAPGSGTAGEVMCGGMPATVVGTRAADVLRGTDGDDVIVGLGGNDQINGFGGNDLICANSGDDGIADGVGDDKVWGGTGKDFVYVGGGDDIIRTGDDADWIESRHPALPGAPEVWTGAGDDQIDLYVPETSQRVAVFAGGGSDRASVSVDLQTPTDLVGGAGIDGLDLYLRGASTTVALDLRVQSIAVRNGGHGTFKQWEGPYLGIDHKYIYHGTNAPNLIQVQNGVLEAHMYGGDDYVSVSSDGPHFVDGGRGLDTAWLEPPFGCISIEFGASGCAIDS